MARDLGEESQRKKENVIVGQYCLAKAQTFLLIKTNSVWEGPQRLREEVVWGDGYFNPAVARQAPSCTQGWTEVHELLRQADFYRSILADCQCNDSHSALSFTLYEEAKLKRAAVLN